MPKARAIIEEWVRKNPNPDDHKFHAFVEKSLIPKGIVKEVDEAEAIMYRIATEHVKESSYRKGIFQGFNNELSKTIR